MEDRLKALLTLVPWTLQRLLRREYEVEWDTNGVPEEMEMYSRAGFPIEVMEEELRATSFWVGLEELSDIRGDLTPERISAALEKIPLLPRYLPREQLLHADWPELVASVFWGSRRFFEDLMLATIESRIGLGGQLAAQFEAGMQLMTPEALPATVAEYIVREIIKTFPIIVERLSAFQVTPVANASFAAHCHEE